MSGLDFVSDEDIIKMWDNFLDEPLSRQRILMELLLSIRREVRDISGKKYYIPKGAEIDIQPGEPSVVLSSQDTDEERAVWINGHKIILRGTKPTEVPLHIFQTPVGGTYKIVWENQEDVISGTITIQGDPDELSDSDG